MNGMDAAGGRLGEPLRGSAKAAWGRPGLRRATPRVRRWAAGMVAAALIAAGAAVAAAMVVYFGGRGAPFAVTAGTSLVCGGSLATLGRTAWQCPDEVWRGLRAAGRWAWLPPVLGAVYVLSEAAR